MTLVYTMNVINHLDFNAAIAAQAIFSHCLAITAKEIFLYQINDNVHNNINHILMAGISEIKVQIKINEDSKKYTCILPLFPQYLYQYLYVE